MSLEPRLEAALEMQRFLSLRCLKGMHLREVFAVFPSAFKEAELFRGIFQNEVEGVQTPVLRSFLLRHHYGNLAIAGWTESLFPTWVIMPQYGGLKN
jgi:hypothetical protein